LRDWNVVMSKCTVTHKHTIHSHSLVLAVIINMITSSLDTITSKDVVLDSIMLSRQQVWKGHEVSWTSCNSENWARSGCCAAKERNDTIQAEGSPSTFQLGG